MAETIENNLRKAILDEQPSNPVYYAKMSEVLDTLIEERQSQAQEYEQYLARIVELARQVSDSARGNSYPSALNTSGQRVLYDNLDRDEQRTRAVHEAVISTRKDSWRGNRIKELEVNYAILDVLQDEEKTNEIFEIVKRQNEY
jgi:type I restriction enzyme R subunit